MASENYASDVVLGGRPAEANSLDAFGHGLVDQVLDDQDTTRGVLKPDVRPCHP